MGFYNKIKTSGRLDTVLALLVAAVVLTKRLLISPYGINREAPIELEAIFSVLDGGLIYRDFFWYHGFLPIYWHALIFKIFSPEMYYLRLFVTFFAVLAAFFAYKVARYFLSPGMAFAAALLGFTGLIIPEHVTGTMMAFCCATISLYYFLHYCDTLKSRSVFFAGLSAGACGLAQVLPLGVGCFIAGGLALICYGLFGDRKHWKALKIFLLGFIPLPLASYGSLMLFVPVDTLWKSLFPVFSGYEASPQAMVSFPVPSLLPKVVPQATLGEWIGSLNLYLFINVRWWLIVLVFIWGLTVFITCWKSKKLPAKNLLLLGTLVLYGPMVETKFLFYMGRLGLVPNYINMLPTFILLFYLMDRLAGLRRFTALAGAGLLILYFVYPFGKYYAYFSRNAVALDMPYADGIAVSPYKHDLYQKTVGYIQSHTGKEDKIVFTGVNRYYSIFSGRKDVFQSNILTFVQSSFYPSRETLGLKRFAREHEEKIVRAIEQAGPKLILFPEKFRANSNLEESPFLSYLEKRWQIVARAGDDAFRNPFEYESPITIYEKKSP